MGIISEIDKRVALGHRKLFNVKKGLISILIHCLFEDDSEAKNSNADPQQSITVKDLEKIIVFYHENGYRFLSQDELANGYDGDQKCCFLTFDDGYYNNIKALKILEKHKVPATFYFSTAPIVEQKSFWWDVYYRERKKLGISIEQIRQEKKALKKLKYQEIEAKFIEQFGENAFRPVDDTDRPFNIEELKDFASNPYVNIGNHTHNHLILPNYSINEIIEDIKLNQELLIDITKQTPTTIAYPNGDVNNELIPELRKLELKAGITTLKGKNYDSIKSYSNNAYRIKRFTPWHHNLDKFLKLTETDFHIKKLFKS